MADTTLSFRNRWIVAVDAAPRRTPGWAAALLAVGVLAIGMYGGGALYRAAPPLGDSYAMQVVDRLLQDVCVLGPLAAGAWVMLHLVERRPAHGTGAWEASALSTASGAGFFLAALALAAAAGAVASGAQPSAWTHRWLGVAVGAALVLVQAGAEEYFFRGWLQPVLAARWGPVLGLLATAGLFAAAHAMLQPLSVLAVVNDALAGLAFGLFALRTGALAAAVGAHWGWNWAEQSLAGATPNPGVDPLGSLFDVDLRGPAWLSGGADEMNGSVCATVALVGLVAVAAWLAPRLVARPARAGAQPVPA